MDEENYISVSKGVFAHKGRFKIGKKRKVEVEEYVDEPWYKVYKKLWANVQQTTEHMRSDALNQIFTNLKAYVSKAKLNTDDDFNAEITTGILLTGVNIHDHAALFEMLVSELKSVTPHIAVLWSRDSNSIKSIIEDSVYQLMNSTRVEDSEEVRKTQCTFKVLQKWHENYCDIDNPLIIVIPDFESFSAHVLRDFILVLSTYTKRMKFALIFGVATTLHVVHRSLSYDVTSKLSVQVFHTQTQIQSLSNILESTVLNSKIPFRITGRAFQLLTDIFLFHNFSVDSFLQSYQLCMIMHFYKNNVNSLCCDRRKVRESISALTDEDFAEIKTLPSVRKYLENSKSVEEFKDLLARLLNEYHDYVEQFLMVLKCLHALTATLPNSPMGKQLREVYAKVVSCNLTESSEYKECLKLLGFLSREELVSRLETVQSIVQNSERDFMAEFKSNLKTHLEAVKTASLEAVGEASEIVNANQKLSRAQLKEKLFKLSQKQSCSPYKQAKIDLVNFLDREVFAVYLINPSQVPTNEIFCFSDANTAKPLTCGSTRAAIDTALNNPHHYLKCGCCKLETEDSIPAALPDLSIIYKLLLESRKLINMYDWLQAFLTIINPSVEDVDPKNIDPQMQARFTRAVSELELLGFIKTSRRKTDHVKRLT